MKNAKLIVTLSVFIFFGTSDLLSAEVGERTKEHSNYSFREDDLNLRNSKIVAYYEDKLELRHCRGPINQILGSEWGVTFTVKNFPFVFKILKPFNHQVGDIVDFYVIFEDGQQVLFVYNSVRQPCAIQ